MICERLLEQLVQLTGRGISLDFSIPSFGVAFEQPLPKLKIAVRPVDRMLGPRSEMDVAPASAGDPLVSPSGPTNLEFLLVARRFAVIPSVARDLGERGRAD